MDRRAGLKRRSAVSQGTIAPVSEKTPQRWWRRRFSLRTLFILMTIVAVVFAGIGWRWRRAQRQAAIVADLRRMGVMVLYDYEGHTSGEGWWGKGSIVPGVVRRWIGDDFFSDVHSVHIVSATGPGSLGPVSAEQSRRAFALAAKLPRLRWLRAESAVVRKHDLQRLSCLAELTDVTFDGCDIRDEDLEPLRRATNVRQLNLDRQPLTDKALAHFRGMSRLDTLGLGLTNVTDDGLAELRHFPELRELWLFNTAVSDRGMQHVAHCRRLEFLELSNTQVGDAGSSELAALDNLRYLNLNNAPVTDEGIRPLARLTRLEHGLFDGTNVTQAGIEKIPSLVRSKRYAVGKPSPPVQQASRAAGQ